MMLIILSVVICDNFNLRNYDWKIFSNFIKSRLIRIFDRSKFWNVPRTVCILTNNFFLKETSSS